MSAHAAAVPALTDPGRRSSVNAFISTTMMPGRTGEVTRMGDDAGCWPPPACPTVVAW